MALPRENRLPLRSERDRVSREGKTFYTRNLTLVVAPTDSPVPRFGILLSKKVAKLAVDRNLIRRRVSSAIAGLTSSFPVADYLVIPKHTTLEIPHTELISDFTSLLPKLK